jgi:uncharacterized protein YegL
MSDLTNETMEQRLARVEKELGIPRRMTTRIAVIQDKSYSMQQRRDETISGYNEYVADLAKDHSDQAYLTLVQFDTSYRVVENNVSVDKVSSLNNVTYVPSGMTALLDAVGRGIVELDEAMKEGDRALVVIMTDGGENSSQEYDRKAVQKMISEREEKGNWTFVFMGAGPDSWDGANLLGVQQSVFYGADAHSHRTSYGGLSSATSGLRSSNLMSNSAFDEGVRAAMADEGATVTPTTPVTPTATSGTTASTKLWTPGEDESDEEDGDAGIPA